MLFARRNARFDVKGGDLPFAAECTKVRRARFPDLRADQSNWRFRPSADSHQEHKCRAADFAFLPFVDSAAFLPAG